jgi:hypothetical protein
VIVEAYHLIAKVIIDKDVALDILAVLFCGEKESIIFDQSNLPNNRTVDLLASINKKRINNSLTLLNFFNSDKMIDWRSQDRVEIFAVQYLYGSVNSLKGFYPFQDVAPNIQSAQLNT